MIIPGHTYSAIEIATFSAGVPADADSTPTGVVYRNGTSQATSVTVTHPGTGRYLASFTADAGWAVTDHVVLIVTAVINSTSYTTISFDSYSHPGVAPGDQMDLQDAPNSTALTAFTASYYNAATSSYNIAGSFGRAIRQMKEGQISEESVVNDASATPLSFITNLTETSDSHYSDLIVAFIDGALKGQSRIATAYDGTSKTLTFDEAWSEAPANGDSFIILTAHAHSKTQIAQSVRAEMDANSPLHTDWLDGGRLDQLLDAAAAASAGSGARTVNVTVDDGTDPLQNAVVRMTEGANSYAITTNASGQGTFNLDDATYTVSISKSGYTYSGTTLLVDGTETVTYSMTAVSITPPSNVAMTTGYFVAYDISGTALASETFTYQQVTNIDGTGLSFEADTGTATSDGAGLVQISMYKGASYKIWRGTSEPVTVVIAANAGSTTELPNML